MATVQQQLQPPVYNQNFYPPQQQYDPYSQQFQTASYEPAQFNDYYQQQMSEDAGLQPMLDPAAYAQQQQQYYGQDPAQQIPPSSQQMQSQQVAQQNEPGTQEAHQQGTLQANADPAQQPQQQEQTGEPVKSGFFARLFRRGNAQQNNAGQPGGQPGDLEAPPAAPQPWTLGQMQGDSKDPSDMTLLVYENAFKLHDDDPRVDQTIKLQFDKSLLGGPKPLPQRLAALKNNRVPKEELGLYTEPQALLGYNSLFKMEQRLAKEGPINKQILLELSSSMAEDIAAARAAAALRKQAEEAALAATKQEQQKLVVGALPSLAEEPEEGAGSGRAQGTAHQQSQQQNLTPMPLQPPMAQPGMMGAPATGQPPPPPAQQPQIMTDPAQAWQALQYHQGQLMQLGAADPNNPNHHFLQSVMSALQQMAEGGPLPLIGMDGMPLPPEIAVQLMQQAQTQTQNPWLDEQGLMRYMANPLKPEKERPYRRYDQDKEIIRTFVRRPILETAGTSAEVQRTYRLDIELGRLEFLVHPNMAREDLLAARLLAVFKEFKRRESVNLVTFYANKLAALEEALLANRENLFALAEQQAVVAAAGPAAAAAIAAEGGVEGVNAETAEAAVQGELMSPELKECLDATMKVEREVVETRQLKEEEEVFMLRVVESMLVLYGQIQQERAAQGYWLTNLELAVQQRPPEEAQWTMGTGVPRDRLDAELLVAEEEAISGMPPPPFMFYAPPSMEDLPAAGFRPRRIEMMCSSHRALVSEMSTRLQALKGRPSADPSDPTIMQLENQLQSLGPVPRRMGPRTAEDRAMALERAAQRVLAGDVGVPRIPKLLPILTVLPSNEGQQGSGGGAPQQPQQITGQEQQPIMLGPRQRPMALRGAASKARYYCRVFVNGQLLDVCQDVPIADDFTTQFKDVFSVQVVRWPESIMLQLMEKGRVRDTMVANIYIGVPGLAGSPHIDPKHVPYQFTSQTPFKSRGPGQQLSPPGSPGREQLGPTDTANLIYPAGVAYVRCGWVSEAAGSSGRMGDAVGKGVMTYDNPLHDRPDVEAPMDIMPPVPNVTVDRMLRRAAERIGGKASRQQVLKWLNQNMIDPNDPRNAALMELMRAHEATSGGMGDLFRLDVFPDVAIEGDRQQGKRTSFLVRRWAAGPFRDPEKSVLKSVRQVRIPAVLGARDAEDMEHLYLDALALVEMAPGGSGPAVARAMAARQDRATNMQIGPNLTKGVEEREARIKEFALRVRAAANRIAGGKQAGRKYKTEDVVSDTPLPEFKVDFTTLARLVAPRRPLKRERKIIKSVMTSVPADTQLMVTIQRATNLPVRLQGTAGLMSPQRPARDRRGNAGDVAGDQAQAPTGPTDHVACFVEVRFRGLSRRTVTCPDEYPSFNEQVLLPVFGTEEEPSPSALYDNDDVITINVFDEIINNRVGEPRVPTTSREDAISDPVRFPERERRFLGCLRVPLSAVYQMQVLDGTFRLEVPPVMLGYRQRSERPPSLSLVMALKPRLAPPAALPEDVLSGEAEDVTRHARAWMMDLLELPQCRTRVMRALAVDADGTSLLASRFVSPLPLPPVLRLAAAAPTALPGISATESVMLKIARFVSMVPYLEDSALQKRRVDVWCTAADTLHMAAGDGEEHAHLLAGYFMEIGQQAFVVMGASTYGARSMFVLTTGNTIGDPAQMGAMLNWNELQLRLWNPLAGTVSSVKDAAAEMREVGMVYDHANMWANIQVSAHPWEIHWQLNDHRFWRPFFGYQLQRRDIATVQTPPDYADREDLFYEQLETRLEEAVRDALQKARSLGAFVTKPDNKVSRVLKSLLREMPARMETVAAASLSASLALASVLADNPQTVPPTGNGLNERHRVITDMQASHNERVAKEARADWINGHILALPFSDKYAEAVAEAVLNTGVHRIADERVKYSLAAYVERGGAAFCCCLWVYVAATR